MTRSVHLASLEQAAAGMYDSWRDHAACVGQAHVMDPPRDDRGRVALHEAVAVCQRCPVADACRDWVLSLPAEVSPGWVVGGLTEDQRNQIRISRGDVPAGHQRCEECGEIKPLADFHIKAGARRGRRNACKLCRCTAQRRTYHAKEARLDHSVERPPGP